MDTADRIETMIRMFNNKEGLSRNDDTLPLKILKDSMLEGATKGNYVKKEYLDLLLDKYYSIRGWDMLGKPLDSTLKSLIWQNFCFTLHSISAKILHSMPNTQMCRSMP